MSAEDSDLDRHHSVIIRTPTSKLPTLLLLSKIETLINKRLTAQYNCPIIHEHPQLINDLIACLDVSEPSREIADEIFYLIIVLPTKYVRVLYHSHQLIVSCKPNIIALHCDLRSVIPVAKGRYHMPKWLSIYPAMPFSYLNIWLLLTTNTNNFRYRKITPLNTVCNINSNEVCLFWGRLLPHVQSSTIFFWNGRGFSLITRM